MRPPLPLLLAAPLLLLLAAALPIRGAVDEALPGAPAGPAPQYLLEILVDAGIDASAFLLAAHRVFDVPLGGNCTAGVPEFYVAALRPDLAARAEAEAARTAGPSTSFSWLLMDLRNTPPDAQCMPVPENAPWRAGPVAVYVAGARNLSLCSGAWILARWKGHLLQKKERCGCDYIDRMMRYTVNVARTGRRVFLNRYEVY